MIQLFRIFSFNFRFWQEGCLDSKTPKILTFFRAAAFVGAIAAIRSNEIRGPNPKFTLFCACYNRQRRRRRRRRSLAQGGGGGGGGDIKDSPLLPATKRQQRRGMRFATYIFSKEKFSQIIFLGKSDEYMFYLFQIFCLIPPDWLSSDEGEEGSEQGEWSGGGGILLWSA